MKTPNEIKKGLEYMCITDIAEKATKAKQGLSYEHIEDLAADALTYIQQLEAAQPKWTSVEVALPDKYQPVIVCRKKEKGKRIVEQGFKDVGDWWGVYGTRTKKYPTGCLYLNHSRRMFMIFSFEADLRKAEQTINNLISTCLRNDGGRIHQQQR